MDLAQKDKEAIIIEVPTETLDREIKERMFSAG
jgi:hypothetical protein